jgi:hypothetical protein
VRSQTIPLLCRVALPLLIALSGCSTPLEPTTSPSAAVDTGPVAGASGGASSTGGALPKGALFPLQLGNRWHYVGESRAQIIPNVGLPGPLSEFTWQVERNMVCVEKRPEGEYMVEQITEASRDLLGITWIRYRQDMGGLYELDLPLDVPPTCLARPIPPPGPPPPPGRERPTAAAMPPDPVVSGRSPSELAAYHVAMDRLRERVATVHALLRTASPLFGLRPPGPARTGELTRLRYPLRLKTHWIIRDGPYRFTADVVGVDALDLPAGRATGYRIRMRSNLYGPADVVHVWYGGVGYLQFVGHFELDAVDQSGSLIGRAMLDEREQLTELHLVSPGPLLP